MRPKTVKFKLVMVKSLDVDREKFGQGVNIIKLSAFLAIIFNCVEDYDQRVINQNVIILDFFFIK